MAQNRSKRHGAASESGSVPNDAAAPLASGLYLLATPIGAARDITLRGLDALRNADMLAAEDTRTLRRLMDLHNVPLRGRELVAYHDANGARVRPRLLARLAEGASMVYASDAGTPLIADPGYRLAQEAAARGGYVTALPGPSAVLTALCLSGLPTDKFCFGGFPPPKAAARRRVLAQWRDAPGALVFFESPRRLAESLRDMIEVFGDRDAAIARELTKKFEEIRRDPLSTLARRIEADGPPKGEIVVIIAPKQRTEATSDEVDARLLALLETKSARDAARTVAEHLEISKSVAYERAVALKQARTDGEDTA